MGAVVLDGGLADGAEEDHEALVGGVEGAFAAEVEGGEGEVGGLEAGAQVAPGIDGVAGLGAEAGAEGQLSQAGSQVEPETFSVLLAHRPERIEAYLESPFDLVVSGHAHGGQWRIPGILNGFIAPNQGLFPQYAGGQYDFEDAALIVSRGLARESTRIPRIFNRPEVVVIDLTPA